VAPEAALLFAFSAPAIQRAAAEEAEKRRVRGIFQRFISPQMARQVIEQGIEASRGKRTELTILFSDIRGFTTLSEKMTPDQVVNVLNEYLEAMTEIIFRHNGTVDKFEGDAIIAFWGAPTADARHAQNAVAAALDMRGELARLREKWGSVDPKSFEIGIGLNTGDVFVGLIGSVKRVNYTIIGDNANLAARLQDLTKEFKWPVLISQATYEKIKDEFDAEFAESRLVKGKTVPVGIYRVLGKKGAPENERVRALYS
jgi:adenylate cyclase